MINCNITLGPPRIVSLSDNDTVVEGESVNFMCEATNDPDAIESITIRWFDNNGHRLTIDNSSITISNTMETIPNRMLISTLTINPVIHQDAGLYSCVALNHPVLMVSDTTQLTVKCKLTSSLSVHSMSYELSPYKQFFQVICLCIL